MNLAKKIYNSSHLLGVLRPHLFSFSEVLGVVFFIFLSGCSSDPCYRGEFKTVHHPATYHYRYVYRIEDPAYDEPQYNCIETASQHLEKMK